MLIDLLIYVALVMGVLVLLGIVFGRAASQAGGLRQNIADIERAMKAGERFRADVRAATGEIRSESGKLAIPAGAGEIRYEFAGANVLRFRPGIERPEVLLNSVKEARVFSDQREHATAWRLEVELDQRQKAARMRPLFTFISTPEKLNAH